MRKIEMAGKKFNRLTVIRESPIKCGKRGRIQWECVCDCGSEVTIIGESIRNGHTKSCGCLLSEKSSENGKKVSADLKKYMQRKYGVDHPSHLKESQDKKKITYFKKYGVDNPFKSKEFIKKKQESHIKKYGVANPMQRPEVVEIFKKRFLEEHGVTNPNQIAEISLKVAKSQNKITEIKKWDTGEYVSCQGSYEVAVINWLNKHQIPFDWQIVFMLPSARSYRMDLYLPQKDVFIEIKGFWRKDALEKFNEFKELYPNCEVWDKNKLKSMGIL